VIFTYGPEGRWKKWFAWRPQRINGSTVWLETIYRRKTRMWKSGGEGASPVVGWIYSMNGTDELAGHSNRMRCCACEKCVEQQLAGGFTVESYRKCWDGYKL
jgi:hypothetical protein